MQQKTLQQKKLATKKNLPNKKNLANQNSIKSVLTMDVFSGHFVVGCCTVFLLFFCCKLTLGVSLPCLQSSVYVIVWLGVCLVASLHFLALPCRALSFPVQPNFVLCVLWHENNISYYVVLCCVVLSCLNLFCLLCCVELSCLVLSYLALLYFLVLVLSCLVVSCLVLCSLVLCCLILSVLSCLVLQARQSKDKVRQDYKIRQDKTTDIHPTQTRQEKARQSNNEVRKDSKIRQDKITDIPHPHHAPFFEVGSLPSPSSLASSIFPVSPPRLGFGLGLVLSCPVLSCFALPCLVLFCVLFCLVLSCLVLYCLVLSCLALSCLAQAWLGLGLGLGLALPMDVQQLTETLDTTRARLPNLNLTLALTLVTVVLWSSLFCGCLLLWLSCLVVILPCGCLVIILSSRVEELEVELSRYRAAATKGARRKGQGCRVLSCLVSFMSLSLSVSLSYLTMSCLVF